MLEVLVDGDACPVKDEVERVAASHNMPVYVVSNGGLRPSANPLFRHITVPQSPDAADDWIVQRAGKDHIVITADIPLAARCLTQGARVLGPTGRPFTSQTIGTALGMRDLHRHLREFSGGET